MYLSDLANAVVGWRWLHACWVMPCCFCCLDLTRVLVRFVSSCYSLSLRVHAPCHRFLSRKPPGLTDAAYAGQPNTLASLVFVSILARAREASLIRFTARLLYETPFAPLPYPTDWLIAWTNGSVGTANAKCLVLVSLVRVLGLGEIFFVCARLCKTAI